MTKLFSEEHYFLPPAYCSNSVATTRDSERPEVYWNTRRLRTALYYQYPVYQYCAKLIAEYSIGTMIDVGCGVGCKLSMLHKQFPKLRIIGIDQPHPIQYCRSTYSFGEWIADDLENPTPDLDSLQAELVICSDVIEHVANPDYVLEYLKRRGQKDGLIVISTPDRASLYGKNKMQPGQPDHVREWTFDEFGYYLRDRGWHIEKQMLTFPAKVGLNSVWIRELFKQLRTGKRVRYNQICLCRLG